MSSLQLSFTLRTSSNCKSVHLLGSWDGYRNQLPMSKDHTTSKSGSWRGTFKFSSQTLKAGQRCWYYYICDGFHVTHDPAQSAVVEPTTKRTLNVLDVPASSSSSSAYSRQTSSSHRTSGNMAHGRGVSPSKIAAPRPTRPGQRLATDHRTINALSHKLANTHVSDSSFSSSDGSDSDSSEIESDASSDLPSLSSGSRSPASSMSSHSSRASSRGSQCSCNRYGLTKKGDRVKLDCGGTRCGGSSDDSDEDHKRSSHNRRHGVVIRGGHSSYRR